MMDNKMLKIVAVFLVLALAGHSFAVLPEYQDIPADANLVIASGLADVVSEFGTAYIEYWVWNGGNGYYYYTYRIHNDTFQPFVKHLTISNPSGDTYFITGISGGYDADSSVGSPWTTIASTSMMVDWVGDETSDVDPGQSSWETPLFQFASALPPASSIVTVHEGDLSTFADGLIVAPGSQVRPRTAGYWKHQFYAKKPKESYLDRANYLTTIGNMTNVVDFQIGLSGTASSDMTYSKTVLATLDNSIMREKAKKQLLALWLNVASHKISYYAAVSYDPEAVTTTADTVKKAIDEIEATIDNTNATLEELENAKDMAEILNCM